MIFNFFILTIFFTNFVVKFFWQIFFTKKLFRMVTFRAMPMANWIFFKSSEKKIYKALKYIVPVVSWSSLGLFSNKQIFFHIDFILIRMCLGVLFSWQKISNKFYWRLFFTNVFDKKNYFEWSSWELHLWWNKKFFEIPKKKLRLCGKSMERRRNVEERLTDLVNVTSVSEEIWTGWVLVIDWIYWWMSKLFIVSCLTWRDWSQLRTNQNGSTERVCDQH